MNHMVARLEAALNAGLIERNARRSRVLASVGGTPEQVDFCMEWLRGGVEKKTWAWKVAASNTLRGECGTLLEVLAALWGVQGSAVVSVVHIGTGREAYYGARADACEEIEADLAAGAHVQPDGLVIRLGGAGR